MTHARVIPSLAVLLALAGAASAQTPAPEPAPTSPPVQAAAAAPAPENAYPKVNLGVLAYFQYGAELDNRGDYNAFDVTRTYLNVTGDLSPRVKFRVTPDIRRVTDGSLAGSLTFRIKYAFIELDDLGPRSWLRFGAHQTPWLDFEESINRYRVQGPMFAEREGVIPGSSDFGMGYLTRLPAGYGEINVGVYNGEGYARAEPDRHKSLQARVTIRPFPRAGLAKGLRLSGFYDAGWFADDRPRRHGILMASFEHPHVAGTVQWLTGTERGAAAPADADLGGTSAFLEVRQGVSGWAALARVDDYTPDRSRRDVANRRVIAGGARWFVLTSVRIGLVATDEHVRYDPGRRLRDEHRVLVQTHVQF